MKILNTFVVLTLSVLFFAQSSGVGSAAQQYYIDPQNNLWIDVNLNSNGNNSTLCYNVYNTPGYAPNGNSVMWAYDNFSSSTIDANKWTVYKEGSNEAKAAVKNGKLMLSGGGGVASSANVVFNKPFTNNVELAMNETLSEVGGVVGRYADVSFGSGALVCGASGTDWWHTSFASGGSFRNQGLTRSMFWIDSPTSYDIIPSPGISLSDYTTGTATHTVTYSYDDSGNANMSILSINQLRLPLSIPDPYEYSQFIHPDVIYNPNGIFGHKYWMFITPYAWSDDELENACLYYSDDGISWCTPPGVTNPIGEPGSDYPADAYGSDPELIYNPTTGKLLLYYVIGEIVGEQTIEDPKVKMYDGSTVSPATNLTVHGVSPAVMYDKATNAFYMWIVDITPEPNVLYRLTSTDGVNFRNPQVVTQNSGKELWHIDVLNRPGDSKLYALLKFVGDQDLYIGTMNSYTDNIKVQSTAILNVNDSSSPTHSSTQLYRSTGVFSDDGNTLRLWIPAKDSNNVWTTFYTQATTQTNGDWKVGKFVTPRAHVMSTPCTQYTNSQKQWMLSQGEYDTDCWVREIDEVWGYQTGHTPKIAVTNMGEYKQIVITPTDSQVVTNYQVMIPADLLGISSQNTSLRIDKVMSAGQNTSLYIERDMPAGATTYPSNGIIHYWKAKIFGLLNKLIAIGFDETEKSDY